MQDERFHDIPRYLNPPARFFFLTPAELGLGVGLFLVFFFVLGMPITGIIVSVVSVMYFKRKKGGRQLDYFKRQMVWKGSPFPITRCSSVRKRAYMRGASQFDD